MAFQRRATSGPGACRFSFRVNSRGLWIDRCDEPDTFAGEVTNQPLFGAAVSDCTARRLNSAVDGCFRDDAPTPNGGQKSILR